MMQHEEIEAILWEYIDGSLPSDERERIAGLIGTDESWKAKYRELMSFHTELQEMATIKMQSSIDFTENVIEQITATSHQDKARKKLFSYAVRALSVFFIVITAVSLVYAFWSIFRNKRTEGLNTSTINLPELNWPTMQLPGNAGVIAAFITVLVALVLIDKLFRRSLVR